jgi:ribosomal-protein-alanine N-acetyltransferase
MAYIFETERLIVRTYTENDRESFFLLNSNPDVVRFIRPVKTREECDLFLLGVIAAANETPLYGRWAVYEKATDSFAGSFAVIPVDHSDTMQLGYALLPPYWSKGYATELTKAGLQYVFGKTPLDIIFGYTEKPNIASQKVLLKSGFHYSCEKLEAGKEIVEFALTKEQYHQTALHHPEAMAIKSNL